MVQTTIVGRVYANWCGHCQALEPIWKLVEEALKSVKKISLKSFNGQNQNDMNILNSLSKDKISVNGYPTIFKTNGKIVEYYGGARTKEDLVKWAKLPIRRNKTVHGGKKKAVRRNKTLRRTKM